MNSGVPICRKCSKRAKFVSLCWKCFDEDLQSIITFPKLPEPVRSLSNIYPGGRCGNKCVSCKILSYEIIEKWTNFILLEMHSKTVVEWSDKLYKVLEAIKCECGEKRDRRSGKCQYVSIIGKIFQIEFDGYNWERVKIKKKKRCREI